MTDDKLEKKGEVDLVSDLEDSCGGWLESHNSTKIEAIYDILEAFSMT